MQRVKDMSCIKSLGLPMFRCSLIEMWAWDVFEGRPLSAPLQAEIVEMTFVRSRFSEIRHGYDVSSRIQKKRPETMVS